MSAQRKTMIVAEARLLQEQLRIRLQRQDDVLADARAFSRTDDRRMRVLRMTESLIDAHRIAKNDDDRLTLDLIEQALVHLGSRLAREA